MFADVAGERLDAFLARSVENLSRSGAQKLLEEGCILRNGKPGRKNDRLEPGDAQISAAPKREYAAELTAAFRLVETGLRLLQTHYPEQIQIQDISQLTAR